MSKRGKKISNLVAALSVVGGLVAAALLMLKTIPADAHQVPKPCDFTTGGGFVITEKTLTDGGNHANFGLVAGCKNGGVFCQLKFSDHETTRNFSGLHGHRDDMNAQVRTFPTAMDREICGTTP